MHVSSAGNASRTERSLTCVSYLGLAATISLLLTSAPAAAEPGSLSVGSHTLAVVSEESPNINASDTRSRATLYEFIELSSHDLGVEGLEVDLSGVAGVDLSDRRFNGIDEDGRVQGNLIVGLVRWQDRKRRVNLALGRQYLFIGAGRVEHLDGLSVRYRTPWNIDVSAFGGRTRPWQLDYDLPEDNLHVSQESFGFSNYAAGGQLRFRLVDHAIASVGFVHEGHGSETVRQNLTAQLGYWGWSMLVAVAGSTLDLTELRPQDLWLQLTSRPLSALKLTADYSYQIPSLTIPKTSIFSVFTLDDYHRTSLAAYLALTERFWINLDGGLRLYETADGLDLGHTVALGARLALGAQNKGSLGLRGEWIDSASDYSINNRLYGAYRFDLGIYTTAEVFLLWVGADGPAESGSDFARRVDETPLSVGGRALAGYEFTDGALQGWSVQAAGSYFATPLAEDDLRMIARLSYRGRWSWGR